MSFRRTFWCYFDCRHIDVVLTYLLQRNFDWWKVDVFWRTLFNVTSMSKKSTSFRRAFFDIISMGRKINDILTLFVWRYFDERKIYVVSTYFVQRNRRKIDVVSIIMQLRCAYFDVFLKDKKLCFFWNLSLISFWYIKS